MMRRAEPIYAIANVTLAEGVMLLTNIVECDYDTLQIGQSVQVAFRSAEDGTAIPVFTGLIDHARGDTGVIAGGRVGSIGCGSDNCFAELN
jgi:hypothetical protein